ncbi:hypothetical protein DENSPDRAFT_258486 [Dentipellis sp. KUC8613]|nr:hypothetical protein DENSPDRAFT_258486 [Dentipellis sp. KUC8613]
MNKGKKSATQGSAAAAAESKKVDPGLQQTGSDASLSPEALEAMLEAPVKAFEQLLENAAQAIGVGSLFANMQSAEDANTPAPELPATKIAFLSNLPDTRLPYLTPLVKSDAGPFQDRLVASVGQVRAFASRMFLVSLLPLSWILTLFNTTYVIMTRMALFPATLFISFYETNIAAVFSWAPSIIKGLNKLFPEGVPSLPTLGEVMTRIAQALQPTPEPLPVSESEDGDDD